MSATIFAGTAPFVLLDFLVLSGLNRPGTQIAGFVLILIPLILGGWAARALSTRRSRSFVALGLAAGLVETLVMVMVFSSPADEVKLSIFGVYTGPAIEDYLSIPVTVAMFVVGAVVATRKNRALSASRGTTAPAAAERGLLERTSMSTVVAIVALALQAWQTFGSNG